MFRTACAAFVLGIVLLPMAQAEEKMVDVMTCRSGAVTMLTASKEAVVFAVDISGITVNSRDKMYENVTSRCVGTISIIAGQRAGNGYCKYMDPSGDFNLLAWTTTKPGGGTWHYIYGTGRWAGVKGGGTYQQISQAKPIEKGTAQSCMRATGKYELKK